MNQPNKENSGETLKIQNPRVIPIDGTPFATVEKDEGQYIIIFGKHMITPEIFSSRGAALKEIERLDWTKILNVIGIYVENAINNENIKKIN